MIIDKRAATSLGRDFAAKDLLGVREEYLKWWWSEVETEYGHVLVFGVNEDLCAAFDFADIRAGQPSSV